MNENQELLHVSKYQEKKQHQMFEQVFMPHLDALYNMAYRLVLDEDEAKDLVQDTYLKAFRFIDSFEENTNAKAWLYRILKNNFINDYRKKSKLPTKVDYQEVENFHIAEHNNARQVFSSTLEPSKSLIGDEVRNAINGLEIHFRTIIIFCDLGGFTYEELSKVLDIPIGTVRSRLHRARKLLKEKLASYAQSMGYN